MISDKQTDRAIKALITQAAAAAEGSISVNALIGHMVGRYTISGKKVIKHDAREENTEFGRNGA